MSSRYPTCLLDTLRSESLPSGGTLWKRLLRRLVFSICVSVPRAYITCHKGKQNLSPWYPRDQKRANKIACLWRALSLASWTWWRNYSRCWSRLRWWRHSNSIVGRCRHTRRPDDRSRKLLRKGEVCMAAIAKSLTSLWERERLAVFRLETLKSSKTSNSFRVDFNLIVIYKNGK